MTIKKWLTISNIVMLIIPIILTFLILVCTILVLLGVTGTDIYSLRERNVFDGAIAEVDNLAANSIHSDLQELKLGVDKLNKTYENYGIALTVYESGNPIYPSSADVNNVIQLVLSEDDNYLVAKGNNAAYSTHSGKYTLMLSSVEFFLYQQHPFSNYVYIGIFIFILVVVIVIITNRILTHFGSKRITMPIEILTAGVHEIQKDNLDYRIEYDYNDEFKSICDEFDKMAQRLSYMIATHQKDEESRKEMIAGISHDLRTPLTSIKAYLEGIEKGVASTPETQKRYIDIIKGEADDMEHIINQLFMFTKLDTRDFPFLLEPTDIGKELYKLVDNHKKEYSEKGLAISLIQNTIDVYSEIDVVQFRNVIYNILGNSLKYKNKEYAETNITCCEDISNVIVTLTDNGPGVPEEAVEKLFEIFYRSDRSRSNSSQGSGLGLAISKKIIESFGGEIHAENVRGYGLSIQISLPKCRRIENEKDIDC